VSGSIEEPGQAPDGWNMAAEDVEVVSAIDVDDTLSRDRSAYHHRQAAADIDYEFMDDGTVSSDNSDLSTHH
jgi:hypothetical protein